MANGGQDKIRHQVNQLSKKELVHLVIDVVGVDTVEERLLRLLEHQEQFGEWGKCFDCQHLSHVLGIHRQSNPQEKISHLSPYI